VKESVVQSKVEKSDEIPEFPNLDMKFGSLTLAEKLLHDIK
jgi:hypothetical protein